MEEPQTIKLTYTLTFADVREGMPMGQVRQSPLWLRIAGMFGWIFFLVSLFLWWGLSNLQANLRPNAQPITPRPDMDDLWLILLPTLMPVVVVLSSYFTVLLKGLLTTELSEPVVIKRRNLILTRVNSVVVMAAIFAGVWLLMHPDFIWAWTPSRQKMVVFSIGPWAFLCVFVVSLAPFNRWLKFRTLWNTTPPLRRPKGVEINHEGMVTIDAKNSCRYRWNYFVRYSETANLLRLHMEDDRVWLIPKRAVEPEILVVLRSLICSNISDGKFIVNDPRFAVLAPQPVIPV